MKAIKIRKSRVVTVHEASDIVTLNPKKFKKLSENPYTGNSDKEFLEYIANFDLYNIPDDLDYEQADELSRLGDNIEWSIYSSSLEKYEESWFESGKEDPSFRKTGGFDIEHSTSN